MRAWAALTVLTVVLTLGIGIGAVITASQARQGRLPTPAEVYAHYGLLDPCKR